jgi:hypothetical protein
MLQIDPQPFEPRENNRRQKDKDPRVGLENFVFRDYL